MTESEILEINNKHDKAMEYAQEAYVIIQKKGDKQEIEKLNLKAYELEKEAALDLMNHINTEPSRSMLFRSAAVLAKDCQKYDEAIQLVNLGLNGKDIPLIVKSQLEELKENLVHLIDKESLYKEDNIMLAARSLVKITKEELSEMKRRLDAEYN